MGKVVLSTLVTLDGVILPCRVAVPGGAESGILNRPENGPLASARFVEDTFIPKPLRPPDVVRANPEPATLITVPGGPDVGRRAMSG
jgi:hypothetical protein